MTYNKFKYFLFQYFVNYKLGEDYTKAEFPYSTYFLQYIGLAAQVSKTSTLVFTLCPFQVPIITNNPLFLGAQCHVQLDQCVLKCQVI